MKIEWWYMDCYKGIQKQNPSNGCNIFSEVLNGEMGGDKIGIEILVKKLAF
jgi:hypothetical protein